MQERARDNKHFMPAALLDSQLSALEVSPGALVFGEAHAL